MDDQSAGPVVVTREQLYEWVWTKPVSALAKSFGLSDVGFAKMCKRLGVPRPGLGHWARKAAGQEPERIPLPTASAGQPTTVTLYTGGRIVAPRSLEQADLDRRCADEAVPERKIVVAPTLEAPHALVKVAREHLARAKDRPQDALLDAACLDVQVSPAALDRALRIMDALVRAFEHRKLKVEITTPNVDRQRPVYTWRPSTTLVHVGEDTATIAMTESRKEVECAAVPPRTVSRRNARGPVAAELPLPPKEYRPTGALTIVVKRRFSGARRVRDGRSSRLEDRLNEVVCEVLRQGAENRRERLKEEAEKQRREEAARQQAELERRQRIESVWVHDLTDRMKDWRLGQDIRAFASAVAAEHSAAPPHGECPVERWLTWARRYADRRETEAFDEVARMVRLPPDRDRWSWQAEQRGPIELPTW